MRVTISNFLIHSLIPGSKSLSFWFIFSSITSNSGTLVLSMLLLENIC